MHTPLPHLVMDYLEREAALERMSVVPLENSALGKNLQISPVGLIPKRSKPGKWRLIVDLSAPSGASVNDGIDKECSSLCYPTVKDLASVISRLGRGAYLVKADVKEAYRMVPVHPQDRLATGDMMGKEYLCGQCLSVWAKICPEDLLGTCRCHPVDSASQRGRKPTALPG